MGLVTELGLDSLLYSNSGVRSAAHAGNEVVCKARSSLRDLGLGHLAAVASCFEPLCQVLPLYWLASRLECKSLRTYVWAMYLYSRAGTHICQDLDGPGIPSSVAKTWAPQMFR